MSIEQIGALLWQGTLETLLMTLPATIISYLIGMPLGVLLVIGQPQGIKPMPRLNTILGTVINFLRSIPFIILVALLFPITRVAMGSAIGTVPFIFPLVISAFPYVARMIEGSLSEVDTGVIEAAQSMGSTTWQLIAKVMIPEAMPSLLNGAAIVTVTVLGYSAMSSAAAGGGLGLWPLRTACTGARWISCTARLLPWSSWYRSSPLLVSVPPTELTTGSVKRFI